MNSNFDKSIYVWFGTDTIIVTPLLVHIKRAELNAEYSERDWSPFPAWCVKDSCHSGCRLVLHYNMVRDWCMLSAAFDGRYRSLSVYWDNDATMVLLSSSSYVELLIGTFMSAFTIYRQPRIAREALICSDIIPCRSITREASRLYSCITWSFFCVSRFVHVGGRNAESLSAWF